MTDWRARLKEMVEADGRSPRAISISAGLGPNYIQQVLTDKKDAGFDRLQKALAELGSAAALYVTTGIKLTPQAESFLRMALSLDESQKAVIEAAISQIEDPASSTKSSPDQPGAASTSGREA